MNNYSLAFRKDGQTTGYTELARTKGMAIWQVLVRTDHEVDELLEVREVFSNGF